MSFSENLVPGEETRQKEMHGDQTGLLEGTKVGLGSSPDDTRNKLSDKKGKEGTEGIETLSPKNNDVMKQFAEFKKNNPEPLPYKDLGTEQIAQAGTEVEREGWPC